MFGIFDEIIGKYWIIFSSLLLAVIYQTYFRYWSYFSKNGVKFIRGWPLVGSMPTFFLGKDSYAIALQKCYNLFPNERFIGLYEIMGGPVYLIRDPELMKQISIKDFDHFVNHRANVSESCDALLSRSLFSMRDSKWRQMRATLSPAFTGSKMRLMQGLVGESAKRFTDHLLVEANGRAIVYDLKDLFTRFACDTIATSAFGLEVNSIKEKSNKFFETGVAISTVSGLKVFKLFGYSTIPKIMNFFKVNFFSKEHTDFFRDLVHSNMSYREKNNVIRHDMINLLMEAKKGILVHTNDEGTEKDIGFATVQESEIGKSSERIRKWQDDDFVAQCSTFFFAGFTTISSGICFMAHELAVNQDIQTKLYKEILAVTSALKGQQITYESLQKMKYLDMVVSETLRRWSISPAGERYVNKPYVLEQADGMKVQLNVGDGVWFPTYPLHMDPKYFPNPDKFDPERFSDANRDQIVSGTYTPFGSGPRNCIGSRFALMEMKSLFVYLLLHFSIEKCDKTQDPLILKAAMTFTIEGEKGFWAKFKPRIS